MKRKARQREFPVTEADAEMIRMACSELRHAVAFLRTAGAINAANYAARALKSADGARRHAEGRLNREAVK